MHSSQWTWEGFIKQESPGVGLVLLGSLSVSQVKRLVEDKSLLLRGMTFT